VVLILNMIALMERFTRGRTDSNSPRLTGLLSKLSEVSNVEARARGVAGGRA
jgi:hypothetical protein